MGFLGELRVEATLGNLRTISHFLHGIGQRLSLPEEVLFDLDIAVEEAARHALQSSAGGLLGTNNEGSSFLGGFDSAEGASP